MLERDSGYRRLVNLDQLSNRFPARDGFAIELIDRFRNPPEDQTKAWIYQIPIRLSPI